MPPKGEAVLTSGGLQASDIVLPLPAAEGQFVHPYYGWVASTVAQTQQTHP